VEVREGLCPSLNLFPLSLKGHTKGESKRGEAPRYITGSFRGAKPLLQTLPLSFEGERY